MSEPTNEQLKARIAELEAELAQLKARDKDLCEGAGRCLGLLDGLGAAVFVGNRDRVLVDVNRRACELLGYSREELVGRPVSVIHVESEMPLFNDLYDKGLSGKPYKVHYMLRTRNGRQVPVELVSRLVDVGGEALMVGVALDISDREALLRNIAHEDRMSAVGTLAEGVAHEFNNLLARILACAGEAQEYELDPAVAQDIRTIVQAAEEGGVITDRLLSYARKRPPERRPVNLVNIIEQTLQFLHERFTTLGVHVEKRLEPLPDMMVDNVQMGQVFMNLAANACDAMPKGGSLTVWARREGNDAVIDFTDTGEGIDPELFNSLFCPFVTTKGPRAGSDVPGMGLGLCVCEGILAGHGGTITAKSPAGKGTTFTVRLPIVAAGATGAKKS